MSFTTEKLLDCISELQKAVASHRRNGEGVPSYLKSEATVDQIDRVLKALKGFKALIKDGCVKESDLKEIACEVLTAILYIPAVRRSRNLYEFHAANHVSRQQEEVESTARAVAQSLAIEPFEVKVDRILILIAYHKIADRVLYKRLKRAAFDSIIKRYDLDEIGCRQLGALAASFLVAAGDQGARKTLTLERMREVYGAWSDPKSYEEDASYERVDIDVLVDYVLCNSKDEASGSLLAGEYGLDTVAIRNFYDLYSSHIKDFTGNDMWYRKGGNTFATIDHGQSRRQFPRRFHDGFRYKNGVAEIGRFGEREEIEVPSALKFQGNKVYLLSFALSAQDAFDLLVGDKPKSSSVVDCLGKLIEVASVSGADGRIPMARLQQCLDAIDLNRLEDIIISTQGGLSKAVPNSWRLRIPSYAKVKANDRVVRLIERMVAAHVVNLGVLSGYDRVQIQFTNADNEWRRGINRLLENDLAGFELMIRYIETYMRSHDVYVGDGLVSEEEYWSAARHVCEQVRPKSDSEAEQRFVVGMDIGATAVKFQIFRTTNSGLEAITEEPFRIGVAPASGQPYKDLHEFAAKLASAIAERVSKHKVTVEEFGICWPGPIRDGKIAGVSGIFKHFDPSVASHLVRKTKVEQIRALDLVSAFQRAWKEIARVREAPTVALCNDGFAEGLGWLMGSEVETAPTAGGGAPRWLIVKLGTGLATSLIVDERVAAGPFEGGKIVEDAFPGVSVLDVNKFPRGVTAERASGPAISKEFKEKKPSVPDDVTSIEVARIANWPEELWNPLVVCEYAIDYLLATRTHLASLAERPKIVPGGGLVLRLREWHEWQAALNTTQDLKNSLQFWGEKRLVEITGVDDRNEIHGAVVDLGSEARAAIESAGEKLGDVIMLLKRYLDPSGVVLCGGVLQGEETRHYLIKGATQTLKEKYNLDFQAHGTEPAEGDAFTPRLPYVARGLDLALKGAAIHAMVTATAHHDRL